MKKILLFLAVVVYLNTNAQKQSTIPMDAFGVWERADEILSAPNINPAYDFLKGFRMSRQWAEIQPKNAGEYNWDDFKRMLQFAVERNKYIYTNILVGPQCPNWIYNDVPTVKANSSDFARYPYYLDEDYKANYFALIENYARLLRQTIPEEQRKRILFVQVMTGSTGDEEAYKGDVLPGYEQYNITEKQWETFRLEAFEKFKTEFLDGDPNTRINLVFNNIDPAISGETEEWNWVINNIGSGFGIKGSAYVRGHHLTYEKTFKDQWLQYLVNPKNLAIYSRAEMDQTFTWPLYQINLPLSFFWGAVSGLNTGLSIWDITLKALEAIDENSNYEPKVRQGIKESYDFFNKYAGQIYPGTASCAYSIFHEGLNSANANKFPENVYGSADKGNVLRYINICNAFAERGAKMDHAEAATYGQVWQRHNQLGYNDAGWEIQEGNYERWIEQIKPGETSVSLWRVNGAIDKNSSKYDRFARAFQHSSRKNAMYFKFHDEVFLTGKPQKLTFKIIWFDKINNSSWELRYDNGGDTLAVAQKFTGTGSMQWKTETIVLTDAEMEKGGPEGSDFALVNTDAADDIFHGVEVDILRINADKVSIVSPQNGAEFAIGDTILVSAAASDAQGIENVRFSLDDSLNFADDFTPPFSYKFTGLGLGQHNIRVKMKDVLGYWLNAEPVSISVIPEKDTVFIVSPQNGTEFFSGSDITVSAYGYDYNGIKDLKFRIDEGSYQAVEKEPYEFTFTGLNEGLHTVQVEMTDLTGNSILSQEVAIQVVKNPDFIRITSPLNGDTIALGSDVPVTVQCFDSDGIERIRFRLDNADNWNNVLTPPYEYRYSGLTEGTYLIEAQMKDLSGNRIFAQEVVIYVVNKNQTTGLVNMKQSRRKIKVYPTLIDKFLKWHSDLEIDFIHICNLLGWKTIVPIMKENGSVDLSALEQGVYFVYFEYNRQLTEAHKIVKL